MLKFLRDTMVVLLIFYLYGLYSVQGNDADNPKWPDLYQYDNYAHCKEHGSAFCMVRAVVKPNSSNEVWNRIQGTISNRRFYPHNLVERAICIERCLKTVRNLSHSERQELLVEPFAVEFDYLLDSKFFPHQSHYRKLYGEVVNLCINQELRSEFGLLAFAEIEDCHEPNRRLDPLDTWDGICIAVICLVIVFAILSTIFDYHLKKKLALDDHFATNLEPIEYRLATIWSVPRNLRSMAAPPKSALGKDFLCLEGVRFATMAFVVMVHTLQMWMRVPLQNPEFYEDAFEDPIIASLTQMATNLVQLFFSIGGLLTAVNLLDFLAKNPDSIRSWRKVLWDKVVNRLKRILPVYLFMILIAATLFRRIPLGPLYDRIVGAESSNCRTNWWSNLLFVNNYVNGNDTCLRASWYLSADLQYYLFGIFALLMMTRFPKTTKYWIGFMVILNFAGPGLEIWFRQLPPISTNAIRFSAPTFFDDEWMEKIYKPFQTSSAGYFYGIMAGMMYHKLKHTGKILVDRKVRCNLYSTRIKCLKKILISHTDSLLDRTTVAKLYCCLLCTRIPHVRSKPQASSVANAILRFCDQEQLWLCVHRGLSQYGSQRIRKNQETVGTPIPRTAGKTELHGVPH
ncbi:uncharacterized protein LOC120431211 isoform X2 [Culex pipiens pallens]|uniref:uncharacterized protein LOC120431211 isoform X2 n=1 Tax=Culex pipiens pallens TaxID=42434 RepID=UPI0022AB3C42|nr:uncharacterized protein LOC120431211 isoform X2 [Culex pipiens pallens]